MLYLIILLTAFLTVIIFLNGKQFGRRPTGKRLERIKQSPNYNGKSFSNINHTPSLTEGVGIGEVMREFFFNKRENLFPEKEIPFVRTNLKELNPEENVLVWFGHSSYFIQVDGKKILVDPVMSGSASPLPFGVKAFKGSNAYQADDVPEIDYLFITHDHWDHLDYKTVIKLKPKIKKIITGLGTGEHFERWGFDEQLIMEKDWNESFGLDNGFIVHTTSARHFSGRGLKRNTSIWLSFVLRTPSYNLFLGGDSGYDSHFAEIGEKFGPFDLAILENGQYDRKWRYIHMLPDEILKASKELKAKRILPVHSSKFKLSNHAWNEPLELIIENNKSENLNIITPQIGEPVRLNDVSQVFTKWWVNAQ